MPNILRQTLLELYGLVPRSTLRIYNEAFDIGSTHYWRYGGTCYSRGQDGIDRVIPCETYYKLQQKSDQSKSGSSTNKPSQPAKKKLQASPKAYKQSPRIASDRIKQVASQESFEVKAGKHTIPLRSIGHNDVFAVKALKNIGIDPVVVSERLIASVADTAGFTAGKVIYGPYQIRLSFSNDSDYSVEFNRLFTRDEAGNLCVHHASFKLPKSKQKGGNAVNMMADALPVYDELGVSRITVAADAVGRYAWLKCGFVPYKDSVSRLVENISGLLPQLEKDFPNISKRAIRQIKNTLDMMSIVPRAAWDLADLPYTIPGSRQTLANYLLVRSVKDDRDLLRGYFDMTDESTRKRCDQYINKKLKLKK